MGGDMVGRVEGKVAFITGAARGQGRSHAVRLASEGADIVAVDILSDIDTVPWGLGTAEDLAETVRQVEAEGRAIVSARADVRSSADLDAAVTEGLSCFGHIDIVCANAGISSFAPTWEIPDEEWRDIVDVNVTGVWRTVKAAVPSMLEVGNGGSIIITSSAAGVRGFENVAHYTAAKHGIVGLMRTLANELARQRIRVNTVHPGTVDTTFVHNDPTYRLFLPDVENPNRDDFAAASQSLMPMPVPWVDPIDVSNAVLWLASDEARFVTGAVVSVDAGMVNKFS
jgi:SDR family mycofactocin-dependent oxidoreductase